MQFCKQTNKLWKSYVVFVKTVYLLINACTKHISVPKKLFLYIVTDFSKFHHGKVMEFLCPWEAGILVWDSEIELPDTVWYPFLL